VPFLGVPAALAALLKVREGVTVDLRPLLLSSSSPSSSSSAAAAAAAPPPRATRVSVTPLSADDWEVVQAQAGLLEENITSQVGVAGVGQPFPVFVPRAGGGGAPVALVATAVEPAGVPAAFLGPGCEFVVAPVARGGKTEEGGEGKKEDKTWK
jgi:peroxin-1